MKFGRMFKRCVVTALTLSALAVPACAANEKPTFWQLHQRAQCAAKAMQFEASWKAAEYYLCIKQTMGIDKPWEVPWINLSTAMHSNPTSNSSADR